MDFDQLITFVEVARLKNFSRAGRKVFRSQPAVSAQIQQLEHECGTKLLMRTSKLVELTDAGELFLDYAQKLLKLRQEALRAVQDSGEVPQGTLSVGANEATILYVLPDVFARYSELYPQVRVSIYRNFTRKIVERLEDGSLDVGIVTLPLDVTGLTIRPIFRDRIMLMVPIKSPLAKLKSVSMAVAAEQKMILPKTGWMRQVFDKLLRPYASSVQVPMELPSVGMIKSFVAAGVGVSLMSESFAQDDVKAGRVKLLPLEGSDLYRELAVAYRSRALPRSAQAFVALIEANNELRKASAPRSSR